MRQSSLNHDSNSNSNLANTVSLIWIKWHYPKRSMATRYLYKDTAGFYGNSNGWIEKHKRDIYHIRIQPVLVALRWRHNGHDGVSNPQPHHCLHTICSGGDQRKHLSSASLAFVQGIHREPVNSLHKWPVTRKMFPFDDFIMVFSRNLINIKSNRASFSI